MTRGQLFDLGQQHIDKWGRMNGVLGVTIRVDPEPTMFGTCAFYRDGVITIWPQACSSVGMVGQFWSYPGYVVDRTPYGVLAHELGHHVDRAHGARPGRFSSQWRKETGEAPITSYCDNDNEWFAECFRLFVTNPSLLKEMRPRLFEKLIVQYPHRAETRDWTEVLLDVPRQLKAASNKVAKARRERTTGG